ncbi:MAG: PD40 domain-containing protein, partial [Deltaproteobacteria bacterium]|nr:PD40 domain-containing protein [Deltaproteobacteria bacterium]
MRHLVLSTVAGLGIALLLAASSPLAAEQRAAVVVMGSDVSVYKVALQRFAVHGSSMDETTATAFRGKVDSALEFSSLFKSIDPKAFLGPLETKSLTSGFRGPNCPDWRAVGADLFIEGVLREEPRRLIVEVQVWDVSQCKKLRNGSKRYKAGRMEADLIARHFVDELIEELTGQRGVSNTEMAFISDRNGNREVYVMNADGSGLRQASRNGSVNSLPGWSPDGKSIYYSSYRTQRRPALYKLRQGQKVSGRVGGDLKLEDKVYRGVMDPSGKKLALVMPDEKSQMGIYLTDARGRGIKRLTHGRGNSLSPSWSPDSKRIAFVSDRTGSPQLYIMDANGKNTRRLTFTGGYNSA